MLVEAHPRENNLVVKKKKQPTIKWQIIATVQNDELVFTELGQHIIRQVLREMEEHLFSEYMKYVKRYCDPED